MSVIQKEDTRATFSPTANIVASELEVMRSALQQLLADGVTELEMDLSNVKMIDSMGLGMIVATHNSLKKSTGIFTVVHASKELYDLFRSMRLTQHFSVSSD